MIVARDTILGVAAMALAGAYYAEAANIQRSLLADAVGADGVPRMIALGMAVSGLALAARGLRRGAARDEPGVGAKALAKAAGLLAILVAYLVAVPVAGYPIAVCALIAAAAFYAGARPGWALAASAAGGAAVFWVTFEWLLGIRLPAGVLAWF